MIEHLISIWFSVYIINFDLLVPVDKKKKINNKILLTYRDNTQRDS